MEPALKKRRVRHEEATTTEDTSALPPSLSCPVSPPRTKRSRLQAAPGDGTGQPSAAKTVFPSPFRLTWIRDLPGAANTDAVRLRDLVGDALMAECWNFNYLHDIDFLKAAFDEHVRDTVPIHVVHGFWRQEDAHRQRLQEQAASHANVSLHCASMPVPFGTHHSKMLILLRHDDTAQVVIHTANMISRDWTNMTQAVWCSPLLPLLRNAPGAPAGTGAQFKTDLLRYLRAYNEKGNICRSLVAKLDKYDFSAVQAALIASVPGRHKIHDQTEETTWGWAALKKALGRVPVQGGKSEIVVQISSIATLGPVDTWLRECLFESLTACQNKVAVKATETPQFRVVFPTADEIRRSLDGYDSGGSIHTKIQSPQQAKQLRYLGPILHHWANDSERGGALTGDAREAGRKRAAPHIKTYIRYGEHSIDWALMTSANLSKQAWGEADKSGEVRIASWEMGVLVWPSLFAEHAQMVGTFQTDTPDSHSESKGSLVGLRIPYNLPLQPYGAEEKPWVATASYHEPDWKGERWVV